MGAVTVRDTASARPAARTNVLHAPKPEASSGNSMGIARLSPTSKTYNCIHHPLIILSLLVFEWMCHSITRSNILARPPAEPTRLCFHDDTSSPMLSTGFRMTQCRNSAQSTVIELSLSILVDKHFVFITYCNERSRVTMCQYRFRKKSIIIQV